MTEQLIAFTFSAVLLTLAPGPDIIYVLVQSMSNGRRAGLITSLGLVSGVMIHTTLVAFGLAVFIKQSPLIYFIIRLLGAVYLFHLAYQTYKSPALINLSGSGKNDTGTLRLFRRGFVMNIVNPKVFLFFLALFPGFLWNPEGNLIFQFYLLGGIFLIQALIIFGLVSLLAGSLATYLRSNHIIQYGLKWLQVIVFIGIGIFILL